jgi:hypothetical protein
VPRMVIKSSCFAMITILCIGLSKSLTFFTNITLLAHQASGYSPQQNGHATKCFGVLKGIEQYLLIEPGFQMHNGQRLSRCFSNILPSQFHIPHGNCSSMPSLMLPTLYKWGCMAWELIPRDEKFARSASYLQSKFDFLVLHGEIPGRSADLLQKAK